MNKQVDDKRTRLIEAANKLVHQQGFNQTSLADIARESQVPVGNVYYYFKTKEDIGTALIQQRMQFYWGLIKTWNTLPDPKQRLAALIQMVLEQREQLARHGCPIGSLCQELHKDRGPLAEKSARVLEGLLAWAEQQFREMGKKREASELALHLVSALQGVSLLTHTFNQPDLIVRETTRLKHWLEAL